MNIICPKFKFTKPLIPLKLESVTAIILHHPQAKNASVEDIHEWHTENGWAGFGYNEYIRKDGTVYIGRGDYIGAQCHGQNSKSYGICCEGDYDIEIIMPEVQKQSLIERIKYHKTRFKNLIGTFPHNYFDDTKCPGKYFPMKEILARIEIKKGGIKLIKDIDEAIRFLIDEKVINSAEYRKKVCDVVEFESEFVLNIANKILELKGKICNNLCK